MPQIDLEQLATDAQEFLDLDPRYFNEDEGAFTWDGIRVYFEKQADWIILTVEQVEITVARP